MTSSELTDAIRAAKRVYIIGNGGSYANAMHIANDLLSRGIRAYTLDPATLVAFANDHGFHQCFSRWIDVVGEPEDLLIALSGSGKSLNILMACEAANSRGMKVCTIFGSERGENMQLAEESQIRIGHEVWKQLNS